MACTTPTIADNLRTSTSRFTPLLACYCGSTKGGVGKRNWGENAGFGGGSIEEYVFARSLGHRSPQSTVIRATTPSVTQGDGVVRVAQEREARGGATGNINEVVQGLGCDVWNQWYGGLLVTSQLNEKVWNLVFLEHSLRSSTKSLDLIPTFHIFCGLEFVELGRLAWNWWVELYFVE